MSSAPRRPGPSDRGSVARRASPPPGAALAGGHAVRRRDRRGRGPRGPLLPMSTPGYRTRAERFDDLVLDAVEELEQRWSAQLAGTEFAVEDVPPSNPAPWERGGVPLGRCFPADAGLPHRVVVYRRPVEQRAADPADLADLVRDVVVEQVAHLLGRSPDDVDPGYGEDH
ncbi:metallopeptidase family protein [Cellulomonas oligotrophica]|nr:metallopeptidase family protein [Cellulomonas oligotrophica]NYD85209.1 putative Zn-dependent protease with MMP-like domain [Cellulomonas oligotrophica]